MSENTTPGPQFPDYRDHRERLRAIEARLLALREGREVRDRLALEFVDRIVRGLALGNESDSDDEDALGALVRNPGPQNPSGQAGAMAKPEEPYFE